MAKLEFRKCNCETELFGCHGYFYIGDELCPYSMFCSIGAAMEFFLMPLCHLGHISKSDVGEIAHQMRVLGVREESSVEETAFLTQRADLFSKTNYNFFEDIIYKLRMNEPDTPPPQQTDS